MVEVSWSWKMYRIWVIRKQVTTWYRRGHTAPVERKCVIDVLSEDGSLSCRLLLASCDSSVQILPMGVTHTNSRVSWGRILIYGLRGSRCCSWAAISQWLNLPFFRSLRTEEQKLFRGLGTPAVINFPFSYCLGGFPYTYYFFFFGNCFSFFFFFGTI